MTDATSQDDTVAYFSMEFALEQGMNTYNGGLGILAGDVVRAFADRSVPGIGVTLLTDQGLCEQHIDEAGTQTETLDTWDPAAYAEELDATASLEIDGDAVTVGVWRYDVTSPTGGSVPVYLLDTNRADNPAWAREITRRVYAAGADRRTKVAQELVLGIGGVRVLDALDHAIDTYHMNEGHASFLALELLARHDRDPEPVRSQCVFTTHTPVAAAHEEFDYGLIERLLGDLVPPATIREYAGEEVLHTTRLALNLSGYVNGVSKRHQWVSHGLFPEHREAIDAITNGVHVPTWVGGHLRELFAHYLPGYERDPYKLAHATLIGDDDLWAAHQDQKAELVASVRERTGVDLDSEVCTLGFARRAVPYKRATLLFRDVDRLRRIVDDVGDLQVVFAGKAFPGDDSGYDILREVHEYIDALAGEVTMTYLPDYDMDLGRLLTAGVDVWLNTPRRPREACGTSGMKAAVNGVPHLSTLDGWWIEGHIEGDTGWKIGPEPFSPRERELDDAEEDHVDAADLYDQLEHAVLPTYYGDRERWIEIMRTCIAFNGSRFHARRMVEEYLATAY